MPGHQRSTGTDSTGVTLMPGFRGARSNHATYRDPEHKRRRARLVAELKTTGLTQCTEPVCVMPTRNITPTMLDLPLGNPWRPELPHDREYGGYRPGLAHSRCNQLEAQREGQRRSRRGRRPTSQPTSPPEASNLTW